MPTFPTPASTLPEINLMFWFLQSLAMAATCILLPKIRLTSIFGATGMVVALAFVNAHAWDAALFFKIPNQITSQALTLIVANGLIFWALVKLLPGIEIEGVITALFAPLVFTFFSILIQKYGQHVDWTGILRSGLNTIGQVKDTLSSATITPTPK